MPLRFALTHRSTYRYARAVGLGPQLIRLRPAPQCRTPILSYALKIAPAAHWLHWQQDPLGNFMARVLMTEPVTSFGVTVDLTAEISAINPFDFFVAPEAANWPFTPEPWLAEQLLPYRRLDPLGPLLDAFLKEIPRTPRGTVEFLVKLTALLHQRIAYVKRPEPGVWDSEQVLREARGSCRDSSWLLVQILRRLGFGARFVSGYLIEPVMLGRDDAELHAWAEVYLPGAGWIGLDPTSGLLAGAGHIPLAAAPDPASAAPISGTVEPVETETRFEMVLRRLGEGPDGPSLPATSVARQDVRR
ncbi:MAG: transglutaminase family protein [Roseomonas sp.]|nr:transglutaminase family protein [Roseomonas sp.]MCA3326713.1 transglutaminase family protein [Roseomonas sp.]MCA3332410.1 transglutaminase family protein [Roseomonas sp.]MCA3336085.1 transglutaminase family protein [Roseomonas sp.]MCA3345488.1 transglutaminase family protein [Roseomonas sp.]